MGILAESLLVIMYYSKFSDRRVTNNTVFVLLALLFTAVQFASNALLLTKSYIVVIGSLVYLFLFSLLYKMRTAVRIFSSIFVCLLFSLSEYITGITITMLLKIDIAETQKNMIFFAICTLVSKFIAFAFIALLRFDKKRKINWLPVSLAFKTLPLPVSTFFVCIMMFDFVYRVNEIRFRAAVLAVCLMLVASNVLVFYIIDRQNDYIKTKANLEFARAQIQSQKNHYSELYEYQNQLRRFRHDIKNKLIALLGLVEDSQNEKAAEQLKHELDFLDEARKDIIDTGNPVIDAVLQSKIESAKHKNIEINTQICLAEPIKPDELQIGVMIGNALDNAIEAVEKVKPENRTPISAQFISSGGRLSVSVKNCTEAPVKDKKFRTTKKDSVNHGFGLNSIKTIAQEYDGDVYVNCENNLFELNINVLNAEI